MKTISELKNFPVIIPVVVAWGEMDSFHHVNNVNYFRYLESARIAYFDKMEKNLGHMKVSKIGPILKKTSAKYIRPVNYPDTLYVGVQVKSITEFEVNQFYQIYSEQQQRIVTEGEATFVTYDYVNKQKVPVPEELISEVERIEGRSVK